MTLLTLNTGIVGKSPPITQAETIGQEKALISPRASNHWFSFGQLQIRRDGGKTTHAIHKTGNHPYDAVRGVEGWPFKARCFYAVGV